MAAAELLVLAEAAREAALADNSDKKVEIAVRAEGAARRALEALGIDKPGDTAPLSLADQLAARGYAPPDDDDDFTEVEE